MDPERWKRVERLYHSVLAYPSERRAAVLEESCSHDPDLLRELKSLLEAREARVEVGSFLSPQELYNQVADLNCEPVPSIVGSTLGPYQILAEIGTGAMGEVYRTRDSRLDRPVALKILPAHFTQNAARVARFRLEAKAASALNHPNIVTIYEIGQADGTWFIAEELVEGLTVRERLASGTLPVEEALDIAIQCAVALQTAHRAGILHRDIKPENIMLRPDGVVKIVDFGLARISEAGPEWSVQTTQAGSIIGTPRYMSPEQARGQTLDARTDIFSLGAVLFEMVTGRPAFPGATPAEVFASLLGTAPAFPFEGVPDGLGTIMARALEKDREARYQTMQEFETDLRDFKEHRAAGASAAASPKRLPRRTAAAAWRGGLRQSIAIAALALAAVLGFVWYFRTARNAPEPTRAMTVLPLITAGGYKDFGSFSPDGKSIVFSWNGGQGGLGGLLRRNIYIKKIGDSAPVQLTFAQQDETHPVWSPDGAYVAFCRKIDARTPFQRFGIYVVPAAGGTPRKITEGGEGVSWSPDAKTVAVTGLPSNSGGIFLIALETGKRIQLTDPKQDIDQYPVFSPDGKWIAFTRSSALFVVRPRGGTPRQLTFDHLPINGTAWTADSKEIVFSSTRSSGGGTLWRVRVAGGAPRRISATLWGAYYPAISRQGDRLLYTEAYEDTNIYAGEGPGFSGQFVPGKFSALNPLLTSSRRDDSPNISPADGSIAFVSSRTGDEEIWVSNRSGGDLRQLTSFGGPVTGTPRWSPDGRWIAFDSAAAGNPNIYIMSPNGGTSRRLTNGPFGNYMPSWSPDSNRIYFKSDRSGSDQIWWIPAGGGAATELTQGGASEALASPDGKLVYYRKSPVGAIWNVPADGGPEEPVAGLERFNRISRPWGVVQQGIYFISKEEGPREIVRFFSFTTRQVYPLLTVEGGLIWKTPDVAMSSDGRRLLIARLDHEINDLMMIDNFQ